MQASNFVLLWCSLILLPGLSCSKKEIKESVHFIPADAVLVLHVNTTSMLSKLSWREIQNTEWFESYVNYENSEYKKLLMKDPGSSGIDISKDMFLFYQNRGPGTYIAFVGTMKNEDDFIKFNRHFDREFVSEKDGMRMMEFKKSVVTWKDGHFIYLSNIKLNKRYNKFGEDTQFPDDSLYKFALELFDQKAKNSLASDKNFASVMKGPGDIKLWMKTGEIYSRMVDESEKFGKVYIGDLLAGSVATATLNFENGRISLQAKQFANAPMKALYNNLVSKNITDKLLNSIPSGDVSVAVACAFPPEMLKEVIANSKEPGWSDKAFKEFGINIDDFYRAVGGEFLFVLSDVKLTTEMLIKIRKHEKPPEFFRFMFAAAVGEKVHFAKLVKLIGAEINIRKNDFFSFTSQQGEKWYTVGTNPAQLDRFLKGQGEKQPFSSRLKGHNFGIYINFHNILEAVEAGTFEPDERAEFAYLKNTLDETIITGGRLKDGYIEFSAELKYKNKSTNSLKQLSNFIDRMEISPGLGELLDF